MSVFQLGGYLHSCYNSSIILFIAVTTTASQIQILTLMNSTKKLRPQQYQSYCLTLCVTYIQCIMHVSILADLLYKKTKLQLPLSLE